MSFKTNSFTWEVKMQKSIFFLFVPVAMVWFNGCAMQRGHLSDHSRPEAVKGRKIASTNKETRIRYINEAKSCAIRIYRQNRRLVSFAEYACGRHFTLDNPYYNLEHTTDAVIREVVSTGMILTNCAKYRNNDNLLETTCYFYRPQE